MLLAPPKAASTLHQCGLEALHHVCFADKAAGRTTCGTHLERFVGNAETQLTEAQRLKRRRRRVGFGAVVAVLVTGLLVYALGFQAGPKKTSDSAGSAGVARSTQTLAQCAETLEPGPARQRTLCARTRQPATAPRHSCSRPAMAFAALRFLRACSAARRGDVAVFVSEVGGDYLLTEGPGLPALKSGLPIVARLEALADQRTNVRVQMPSGKIDATPHATMPIVPLRLFDSAGACGEIPVLLSAATTDAPTAFKLLSTTVRCPVARAILWAWSATQALHAGASEPPKARLIAGWRCHGADLQRSLDWGTYVLVRCSKNDSSLAARDVPSRTTSASRRFHTDS